jgi:hypothetical protein
VLSRLLSGLILAVSLPIAAQINDLRAYREVGLNREGNAECVAYSFDETKTGCSICHSVDGTESKVGAICMPLAKLPRRENIQAILSGLCAPAAAGATDVLPLIEAELVFHSNVRSERRTALVCFAKTFTN